MCRQLYSGSGLEVRLVGLQINEVTDQIIRESDYIFIEEIGPVDLYLDITQALKRSSARLVVFLPAESADIQKYQHSQLRG